MKPFKQSGHVSPDAICLYHEAQAVVSRAIAIQKPVKGPWAILLGCTSIGKLATGVSKYDLTILTRLDRKEIQP